MQPPFNDQPNAQNRSGPMPPVGGAAPYEDTGYAPELRAERSENLYRKNERFWQHVPDPEFTMHGRPRSEHYFNHPEQFQQTRPRKPPKGKRGSRVLALVIGVALILMVVTVLFASPLFAIENVRVVGNSRVSADEIINRSGITKGMNRFFLNADEVTARVQENYYLICELVHMPEWHTVEIRVREREVVAIIDYNGLLYFADNRGMIFEEFSDRKSPALKEKILVTGMDVRRCDIGRTVTLLDSSQLGVYTEIFIELKVMSALDRIEELDMTSMESIFLTTRDGFSVRLGNGSDIHMKLRSMLLTLDELDRLGYRGGEIDVSAPVHPTFISDGQRDEQPAPEGEISRIPAQNREKMRANFHSCWKTLAFPVKNDYNGKWFIG